MTFMAGEMLSGRIKQVTFPAVVGDFKRCTNRIF